ncbi:MAG: DUF4956 domain-containing protein [Clostridia bacterium]|nr:DUF4956 domain-containing protein [Clostridia bacterium]
MTFKDIFKNSFLEGYAQISLTPLAIAACLLISCLIGIYIFAAYRILCRKSFYNKNFSISLIAISVITASIILAVQSNVVISLGMVGALSIVRFRTAIKDPMDLAFLFWSISCGIICGAGLAIIAVALSVIMSVVIWIFNALPVAKAPVLLLVTATGNDGEKKVMETVGKHCRWSNVKSRTFSHEQLDLVIEVRSVDEGAMASSVMAIEGVTSVSVLAHDGEVTF